MSPLRVAIIGTFDVSNFGDLLFPLIAEQELTARLGAMKVTRYSYRDMSEKTWPYSVRSVNRLPEEASEFDLLIVGGGHLVRFDKEVAPGYEPVDADVHHPTGYWLTPTFLASISGIPVAWNGLGVSPATPRWARELLGLAVRAADYVSVRDEASSAELQSVAPGHAIRIIPDSVFGIGRLLPAKPSEAFKTFCKRTGLTEPYITLQPSLHLLPRVAQITQALDCARSQGLAILELPIGPALGDWPGNFSAAYPMIRTDAWPHPLLLAEIISRSSAVIAQSLHLSVVAAASGVPVHRYASTAGTKHHLVEGLRDVHLWEPDTDSAETMRRGLGRRSPGHDITERVAQLDAHWDAIAALAKRRVTKRPALLGSLITACITAAERSGEGGATGEDRIAAVTAGCAALKLELAGHGEQLAALNARSERTLARQTELLHLTREVRDSSHYQLMIRDIKRTVDATLTPGATVLVASRGDDELLAFAGRKAWHFPREDDGTYSGSNPGDGKEAIAQLMALRKDGAEFLVLPATMLWWLDYYAELNHWLRADGKVVLDAPETCMIFALPGGKRRTASRS